MSRTLTELAHAAVDATQSEDKVLHLGPDEYRLLVHHLRPVGR